MNSKTILFVLFSVGLLFLWNTVLFPPAENNQARPTNSQQTTDSVASPDDSNVPALENTVTLAKVNPDDAATAEKITLETDLVHVELDSNYASITSYNLQKHLIDGVSLDLIFDQDNERGAFELAQGNNTQLSFPGPYFFEKKSDTEVTFWQNYQVQLENGELSAPFKMEKTFALDPQGYLFAITVKIENSVNEILPLNFNNYSYSLRSSKELGPSFKKMQPRQVFRDFAILEGEKKEKLKIKNNREPETFLQPIKWGGINSKYFSSLILPPPRTSFTAWQTDGNGFEHRYQVAKTSIRSSLQEDTYYVYMGPRIENPMTIYNDPEKNSFGLINSNLEKAIDSGGWLSWLEAGLKYVLDFFYGWIPNYGVAIIFLTIVIKLLLFPITHKSYESTARMQKLQPQMKELQTKYKANPQKLNAEMAKLYKTYGVNPLGGCLPLLVQFPFFIALYQMLNKNFDLRGAVFIPGLVTDLSLPDSLFSFSVGSFEIIIRLMPIIYLGTQLLIGKTMPASSSPGMNPKIFTVYMPIIFTFIMYSFPSGLLIYWSLSNLITIGQQRLSSNINKNKKADLVPTKKKKGRLELMLEEQQRRVNQQKKK